MINEKIKAYYELKNKIDELTKEKEQLGEEIKDMLSQEPNKTWEGDGLKAKLVERVTYKYTDETAILSYLTQKGLSDVYLTKKIDSTKLNKELKNKGQLYEALKPSFVESVSDSLTVQED